MKRWLGIFLLWALITIPWSGQAESWRDSFQQQIQQWTSELAQQDQRFSSFTDSSFTYEGLGPNSKQWLITFTKEQATLGYMVVSEDPSGFVLLEYGLGEYVLFDKEAVSHFTSTPQDLSKYYAGLESVWMNEGSSFDAKSGEKYPSETKPKEPQSEASFAIRQESTLESVLQQASIPPTEPWMKPGQAIKEDQELMMRIGKGEVSFIAQLFQDTVTAPFKVIGYHQWSDQLFVELEDYGSRYIPFQYAVQVGAFYE